MEEALNKLATAVVEKLADIGEKITPHTEPKPDARNGAAPPAQEKPHD
ncbi:MAG TPA: hypothetical protein VFC51_11175 [Chloroflexota bacterium]|nr:hypothetical protein [Chloroflexota bacterium]